MIGPVAGRIALGLSYKAFAALVFAAEGPAAMTTPPTGTGFGTLPGMSSSRYLPLEVLTVFVPFFMVLKV